MLYKQYTKQKLLPNSSVEFKAVWIHFSYHSICKFCFSGNLFFVEKLMCTGNDLFSGVCPIWSSDLMAWPVVTFHSSYLLCTCNLSALSSADLYSWASCAFFVWDLTQETQAWKWIREGHFISYNLKIHVFLFWSTSLKKFTSQIKARKNGLENTDMKYQYFTSMDPFWWNTESTNNYLKKHLQNMNKIDMVFISVMRTLHNIVSLK